MYIFKIMTIDQKVAVLESANENTIIGMSVQNSLVQLRKHLKYGFIYNQMVDRIIDNVKKSWDDNQELTQSCFAKHLNDIFK